MLWVFFFFCLVVRKVLSFKECESAARFVSLACPQLEGYIIEMALTYHSLTFQKYLNEKDSVKLKEI